MNRRFPTSRGSIVLALVGAAALAGCGATPKPARKTPAKVVAERRPDGTIVDDHALCDFKDRKDVEVSETSGVGAVQPNIRRVWRVIGEGSDRRKVLICREVDTNLDGIKDVVRMYGDDGQSKEERADSNYDGQLDTWNIFSRGRLSEVRLDRNFDGKPDEWKVYVEGKLSRVKRDQDFNEKADVWEMYRTGRLERIGLDLDGDERVDRWDRDVEWLKKLAQEEQKKQEEEAKRREEEAAKRAKEAEAAAAKEASTEAETPTTDGSNPSGGGTAAPAAAPAAKKTK